MKTERGVEAATDATKSEFRSFVTNAKIVDATTHWSSGAVRPAYRVLFSIPSFREYVRVTDGNTTVEGVVVARVTGNPDQIELIIRPSGDA